MIFRSILISVPNIYKISHGFRSILISLPNIYKIGHGF